MLRSGRNQVDARGFYARMAEQVGEFRHITADAVKRPREQMPQVVREHLGGCDACRPADRFHLRPDLRSG